MFAQAMQQLVVAAVPQLRFNTAAVTIPSCSIEKPGTDSGRLGDKASGNGTRAEASIEGTLPATDTASPIATGATTNSTGRAASESGKTRPESQDRQRALKLRRSLRAAEGRQSQPVLLPSSPDKAQISDGSVHHEDVPKTCAEAGVLVK